MFGTEIKVSYELLWFSHNDTFCAFEDFVKRRSQKDTKSFSSLKPPKDNSYSEKPNKMQQCIKMFIVPYFK